jgi:hypothetical protein
MYEKSIIPTSKVWMSNFLNMMFNIWQRFLCIVKNFIVPSAHFYHFHFLIFHISRAPLHMSTTFLDSQHFNSCVI